MSTTGQRRQVTCARCHKLHVTVHIMLQFTSCYMSHVRCQMLLIYRPARNSLFCTGVVLQTPRIKLEGGWKCDGSLTEAPECCFFSDLLQQLVALYQGLKTGLRFKQSELIGDRCLGVERGVKIFHVYAAVINIKLNE